MAMLIVLQLPTTVKATDINYPLLFRRYGTKDGLPSREIIGIVQDKKGFIWMGTKNGLSRFDGHNFRTYLPDDKTPTTLSSANITCLSMNDSILWIGTLNGLNRFDLKRNIFSLYQNIPADSGSLNGNFIHALLISRNGSLWIGTRGAGIAHMIQMPSFKNGYHAKFRRYEAGKDGLANNFIRRLYQDKSGRIWIATSYGLSILDPKTNHIQNYFNDAKDPLSISSNSVFDIVGDKAGRIWISTLGGSGLQQALTEPNGRLIFKRFPILKSNPDSLHASVIFDLHVDKLNRLWLASSGSGLVRYDGKRFKSYTMIENDQESLSGNHLFTLAEDKDGGLWCASNDNGVSYTSGIYRDNTYFHHLTSLNSALPANNIFNIKQDKIGRIWLGTDKGVYAIRITGDTIIPIWKLGKVGSVNLENLSIDEMLPDSKNAIWFSSDFRAGLAAVDIKTGKLRIPMTGDHRLGLSSNSVTDFFQDSHQRLWVGSFNGVSLFTNDHFKNFIYNPGDSSHMASAIVNRIIQENDSTYWLGTENGLTRLIFAKNGSPQYRNFYHQKNIKNALASSDIRSLYINRKGKLWIGSDGGGLAEAVVADHDSISFINHNPHNGFPVRTVKDILADNSGRLWLSSEKGIISYDPKSVQTTIYNRRSGLTEQSFNYKAVLKLTDGRLLFGGQKGVYIFNPSLIDKKPSLPPTRLTAFSVLNKPMYGGPRTLNKTITYAKAVHLKYSDNIFSFSFAALDYRAPLRWDYAYKLDGFDQKWNFVGERRRVQYTNLDPGKYRFRVKAVSGKRGGPVTSIPVIIVPPYWRTWWAYLGYLLMIVLILAAIRRYEKNKERLEFNLEKEKSKAEEWREINQAKNTFFANISHEFRTPLTLIISPLQQMLKEKRFPNNEYRFSVMLKQAQRLLNLVNQLLDISKAGSGNIILQAQKQDFVPVARGIFFSFSSFAEEQDINTQFDSAYKSLDVWFDKTKLEEILVNLISNAFKFTTPGGDVCLRIFTGTDSKGRECVISEVKDSGPGIASEDVKFIFDRYYRTENVKNRVLGTGLGLALVKQWIELHHGEISVESSLGKGTIFRVMLPLGHAHLTDAEIAPTDFKANNSLVSDVVFAAPDMPKNVHLQEEQVPTVLLVDDTPEVLDYIHEILSVTYNIVIARNGSDGIKLACENLPDIIVSDVMMPGMNGYELCEEIKSQNLTNHIPVILLTARAADEDKLTGLRTGADAYVVKPFNPQELQIRIQKMLEQRRIMQQKFAHQFLQNTDDEILQSMDARFLQQAAGIVKKYLDNASFNVDTFADEMAMSRMQLHRKMKALTGKSTTEFIRFIRLKKAADLLRNKTGNVAEVAFAVGFNNTSYFVRCFRSQYGLPPSQYA